MEDFCKPSRDSRDSSEAHSFHALRQLCRLLILAWHHLLCLTSSK